MTRRTRAILPTHLNGRTADMQALGAIAKRHDLVMVEDAAQALGSRFQGRTAGSFGAAGAISFFPAKMLGCLGDGGAVLTNDDRSPRARDPTPRSWPRRGWRDRELGTQLAPG